MLKERGVGPFVRLCSEFVVLQWPNSVHKTDFYTPAVMGEQPWMFWTRKQSEHVPKRRVFSPSVRAFSRMVPCTSDSIIEC